METEALLIESDQHCSTEYILKIIKWTGNRGQWNISTHTMKIEYSSAKILWFQIPSLLLQKFK